MKIDILREKLAKSSANVFRETSAYLSVSSILYIKRIEVQNNNLSWADQVNEIIEFQSFLLSYASSKVREANICNKATRPIDMSNLYGESANNYSMNMYNPRRFKMSFISCIDKQPAKPNSWDRKALLISFFGTTEFIEIDTNNISKLLLQMSNFI